MKIIDLCSNDEQRVEQVAKLLMVSFQEHWPSCGWTTLETALKEVYGFFGEDCISRVAVDETGTVLGWIAGLQQYDGFVWELHPLVVDARFRRQGIGKKLVQDLEEQVKNRGGLTIWVGTDDEDNMTSLSGVDLYQDTWEKIRNIQNFKGHPYEFYQKCGFQIVGVMPDANGVGKPDIYMAKSVKLN
jgi:aminoglycoside 6'-N-acetyltransferase I